MSNAVIPAAWYPDPENPHQLRYWDGTAWTHHTSPIPQTQQAPYAEQPIAPRAPRKPGAWTRSTLITLFVCIALVVGGAAGAVALTQHQATAHERQAQEALDGFLENATAGDEKWRDFANQNLLGKVTIGAPIRGEETTAEALDLTVKYEVGELQFQSDLPSFPSDLASADLKLSYTFTVNGEEITSTAMQEIWLTRPFYYGDDVPQRSSNETPTAIGPWRVTSMTLPRSNGEIGDGSDYFTTDIEVPAIENVDDTFCFDAPELLEDISTAARTHAEVRSYCFFDDGDIELGENVDLDDLAMSFPPIDALNQAYLPPELIQVDPGVANNSVPPLREYLIRGAGASYVLTVAYVETSGGSDSVSASNRIVSIQQIAEDAS